MNSEQSYCIAIPPRYSCLMIDIVRCSQEQDAAPCLQLHSACCMLSFMQECLWESRGQEPLVAPTCGKWPECPFVATAALLCPFAAKGRYEAAPDACKDGSRARPRVRSCAAGKQTGWTCALIKTCLKTGE